MNSEPAFLTWGQTPGSRDEDPSVFANKSGTSLSQLPYPVFEMRTWLFCRAARCAFRTPDFAPSSETPDFASSFRLPEASSRKLFSILSVAVDSKMWTGVRTFVPKGLDEGSQAIYYLDCV